MRLSTLARGFTLKAGAGDPDITLVTEDSRRVRPGALFAAVIGTERDGHDFVRDALDRGAAALAVSRPDRVPPGVAHIVIPADLGGARALGTLAARFHGNPAAALTLVGFTGTFGKTTTSEILRALLDAAGMKPAVIGSLGARFGDFHDPGDGLTTPAAPRLHEWLAALSREGARSAIVEVTSHALRLGRVEGLQFDGGLLAAIMPGEHTDFHHSYEDYIAAKRRFLSYVKPTAVLAYDADNRASRQIASEAAVAIRSGVTFGPTRGDDLVQVRDVVLDERGASFRIGQQVFHSGLLGRPNVRNAALALSYALASGLALETASNVLSGLRPLRRRMERFDLAGRAVLDDTAGHPESLLALFEAVPLIPRERLWIGWAIRGSRGADVNRANAFALADLASLHGAEGLFITAASDETEPKDASAAEEVDAVRAALRLRGRAYEFFDTLAEMAGAIAARSATGDLVVLAGAQGMNEGKRLLTEALATGHPG